MDQAHQLDAGRFRSALALGPFSQGEAVPARILDEATLIRAYTGLHGIYMDVVTMMIAGLIL